jgi:hypothetical protein
MKTSHSLTIAGFVCAAMALSAPFADAKKPKSEPAAPAAPAAPQPKVLPVLPVGWIDAYPTIVQTGTHPTVSWGVNVPSEVLDVIKIEDDVIIPKEEICLECRVLGNGVTVHYSNGKWDFVPAEALISRNGSSYERVFYGTNKDVKTDEIVWQRCEIAANETIRFAGRYRWDGSWGNLYHSTGGTQNVRTLVHGQVPPAVLPAKNVPSLEEFIKPYLDSEGRVNIGPMDVIVFMELTHSDSQMSNSGYDLQDMVMLCNVKPKPKNNNRSGLADGTNPGQGNQMGNNNGTLNPNQANR